MNTGKGCVLTSDDCDKPRDVINSILNTALFKLKSKFMST